MQCRYCRAWNQEEEHRCARCGRRLHLANARPAPETYPIQTATAPDLALAQFESADAGAAPAPEPQPTRIVYQRPLFRELQTVMPIPALAPAETRETSPQQPRPRPPRRAHLDQQILDFSAPRMRTSLEAVIYCDAPVASPVHRLLAAALDFSILAIALGVFVIVFHLAGGEVNRRMLPILGAVAAITWLLYNLLFVLGAGDTPGTCWAQLRVVNFDGQRPGRDQRAFRVFASCISIVSVGLGVLWALVDEEKLTWHDHISKTFPTPSA